ncbi:MAG: SHOCT domain-containing protein [Ilumatobacteraceae bacterium]
MFWNDGWGWAWMFMIPMVLIMWAAIAFVVLPWMRTGRDQSRSPAEILEARFAAGEISVEEYRERRAELP